MTTPAAANGYLMQHLARHEGLQEVIYNPHDKPVAELPVIYGFNNGGPPEWLMALAVAEDGTFLGKHVCSAEGYMPADLGILEDTRPDRHKEEYQPHYPDGYRMEWVPSRAIDTHAGLQAALAEAKKLSGRNGAIEQGARDES